MKYKFFFLGILVAAILLRFWNLGSFPPGLTWDEAAIGYNAYGLVTNHRDEWLNRTPLSFKSFGDYKSPLGIYLTALPVAVFGLNAFAVRLPVALSGVGMVAVGYFLAKEIIKRFGSKIEDETLEKSSLLVMALLAVSPWALHYSMIGFEANIAAFLSLFGCLGLFKIKENSWWAPVSAISFSLSLYAYHSAKIVVPLLILTILAVLGKKEVVSHLKKYLLFFGVCFLVALPLAYLSLFGKASDRLYSSTILTNENRQLRQLPEIATRFVSGFVSHLNPGYLFLGQESNYRQSNGIDGILSPFEGLLIVLAIFVVVRNQKLKVFRWLFIPIVISIIPAALGVDVPHSNRSLLGLFWWQMLAGVGLLSLLPWVESLKPSSRVLQIAAIVIAFVVAAPLARHLRNDAKTYASSVALADMQYGYKEAIEFARSKEPEVDRVFFTNDYGQAYIYLLFYKKLTPMEFRGGGLANYVITDNPWKDGAGSKRVLIVGSGTDFPEQVQGIKDILYPDGKLAFRIVEIK